MLQEYINSTQRKIEQNYQKNVASVTKPKVYQTRIDALSKEMMALRRDQSLFLNSSLSYRILHAKDYARIKKAKQEAEKRIPVVLASLAEARTNLASVKLQIEKFKQEKKAELKKLEDTDYVIASLMQKDPTICSSIGFMMQCVKHDHSYIVHDKSNANNVYEVFLQALLQGEASEEALASQGLSFTEIGKIRGSISACLKEIQQPKAVEEGMYKIPQKYLYEEIRNAYSNGSLGILAYAYQRYRALNGKLSQAEGEALEKLYKNKDSYTYLHCLDSILDGYILEPAAKDFYISQQMDYVCRKGAPNCARERDARVAGFTAISNKGGDINFLDFAEFCAMTDLVVALQCSKAEGTKEIDAVLGAEEQKLVPAKYVAGYFNNGRYTANPYAQSKTASASEATDSEEKE